MNIKEKLNNTWNWVKDKTRRLKKWIIGIVIGGTAIAIAATVLVPSIPIDLQLRCPKEAILGYIEYTQILTSTSTEGIITTSTVQEVKYACKSVQQIINKEGEVIEKRTKYSRTTRQDEHIYKIKKGETLSIIADKYKLNTEILLDNNKEIKDKDKIIADTKITIPTIYTSEFISTYPQYYEDENGIWWQVEYATTTKEAFDSQTKISFLPIAYATVTDFYPDPNVETATVDGFIRGSDATYATAQSKATGDEANDSATESLFGQTTGYHIYRSALLFDTAAIGTDTISAATLTICGRADGTATDFDATITTSTPASNTALALADYDQFGTVDGGSTTTVGWVFSLNTVQPNVIDLNATGIGWITKDGITKLGTRSSRDISATAPSGDEYVNFWTADQTGTDYDPKLTVTHSAVAAAAPASIIWFE